MAKSRSSGAFEGFPPEAFDFYAELSLNNNRDWWLANKHRYDEFVRRPVEALAGELDAEFGPIKVFRPYRDARRVGPDDDLYKSHQGMFANPLATGGWYLHVDADGLLIGAGCYHLQPDQLARWRAAVDAPTTGQGLIKLIEARRDFELAGDQLKTKPRGFDTDHPRLDLLRYRTITLRRTYYDFPEWLSSPDAADRIRADWRRLRPFVEWMVANVGPSERPER